MFVANVLSPLEICSWLVPVWGYLYDIPALQSLQAAEDSLWGNKAAV